MKLYIPIYGLAVFVRLWLAFSEHQDEIAGRVEVSTPVNSFRRILESHYRMDIGIDPYSSDVLHESPLHLQFYKFLIQITGKYLPIIFIICDVATAIFLYLFAQQYTLNLQIDQYLSKSLYIKNLKNQMLTVSDYETIPLYVIATYLFNPYLIFSCVGCTTTVFLNLTLALFLYGISKGFILISAISLMLSTVQALYPVILVSTLYLSIQYRKKSTVKAIISVALYMLLTASFIIGSYYIFNNYSFLQHAYVFILRVTDQQPNIGVFWYFFMEMFEHFKELFIYSYQINVTILYFIPVTIKFRKDPILLAMCFIILLNVFKSYPSIGDFGFILALLPCLKYIYNSMQQIFISILAVITTTALTPILWELWIYWGSANANFYFGSTLAFITAHIFILTDISFAYSKHDYLLKYGNSKEINGKVAVLVLE